MRDYQSVVAVGDVGVAQMCTPWLTAREACCYLGLSSVKALYERTRRGQIPTRRMGRSLRFHRDELDRVLLEGRGPVEDAVGSVVRRLSAGKGGR
jgi:excisionase family DNA binding protein